MPRESPDVLLKRIRQRVDILHKIREGTDDRRELVETLSMSRSTINRAFSELIELGLLRERHGGCELTLYGEGAYQSYRQIIEFYEILISVKPVLLNLPPTFPFDFEMLQTATVYPCERPAPRKPFTALRTRVESAIEVRVISPVVMPFHVELYYPRIIEHELSAEFILARSALDYLLAEYPEKGPIALQAENTTFRTINEEPPFGLVLIDGKELWLGVYDEKGRIVGAITNTTKTAVKWASSLYDEYRESSENILSSQYSTEVELYTD